MSLVISVAVESFAVVVSDGLVTRVDEGVVVPVASNLCKFCALFIGRRV
jgi:hypothetical protein